MAETDLAIPDLEDKRILGLSQRFQPQNLTELMTWAKLVDKSGLAPKGMNEAAIVICVQMGAELQITPTQALQNVAVINGRPSIFGDLGLALFRRDAKYKSFEEDKPDKALKQGFGRCKIVMKDDPTPIERTFSIEEAKTAKLWGKEGPWTNYPGRMLMFRARWWAMRDAAPEVFKGLSAREEVEDIVDVVDARVDGEPLRAPRARTGTPSVKDVEAFVKETRPAPGSPAAVDRSKLQTVMINNVERKDNGTKVWYEIAVETATGEEITLSTFSTTDGPAAEKLKGEFALVATKITMSGGKKYVNLTHIEPVPAKEAEAPPAGDEPGSNG